MYNITMTDRSGGTMRDGRMHGYWEWFRKDGTKMRSGHFECGKRGRRCITYDKKSGRNKKTVIHE